LQRVKSVQLKAIKAGRLVADTAKAGGKKNKSQ
jgi:hypothetical protein